MNLEIPIYFNTKNFEEIVLKKFNNLLDNPKSSEITIDLSKTQWIDLFSLVSIMLMINKLCLETDRVNIELPACFLMKSDEVELSSKKHVGNENYLARKKVCSFLERWNFFDLIKSNPKVNLSLDLEREHPFEKWNFALEDRYSFVMELKEIEKLEKIREIRNWIKFFC